MPPRFTPACTPFRRAYPLKSRRKQLFAAMFLMQVIVVFLLESFGEVLSPAGGGELQA